MASFKPFLLGILTIGLSTAAYAQDDANTSIRVQLKPAQESRINSPMSGQISDVSVKDGDAVKKGQTLIRFKCDEQKALMEQANARMNRQKSLLAASEELFKLDSASETEVEVHRAEYAEANAAHKLAKTHVQNCTIKAPFSGHVSYLAVKDYYSAQEGEYLIEIVGQGNLEVEMIVPSNWMRWLKPDAEFNVSIDETSTSYPSKITRLGGRVDPITQTIKAYGIVQDNHPELLSGMSGYAIFNVPSNDTAEQ